MMRTPDNSFAPNPLHGSAWIGRWVPRHHLWRLPAIILLCLSVPAPNALASERDPEHDLRDANHRYDLALVAADASALDALYLPEFTYIGPGGVVRNKAEQIRSLASGAIDIIEGGSDHISITIYGDAAILTGRFTGRVRAHGEVFSFQERYSTVWINRGNGWRLALERGTVIKDK